jgi:hypothetical protein
MKIMLVICKNAYIVQSLGTQVDYVRMYVLVNWIILSQRNSGNLVESKFLPTLDRIGPVIG